MVETEAQHVERGPMSPKVDREVSGRAELRELRIRLSNTAANALRPAVVTVNGPFEAFVEIQLEVSSTAGAPEEMDYEIHVTAILEE